MAERGALRGHPQGIKVATSQAALAEDAIEAIAAELALGPGEACFLLVFASPIYDTQAVADALAIRFPKIPHAGATTAGEIGPDGIVDGSIVVMAFPSDGFRVVSALLPDLKDLSVDRAADIVRTLRAKLAQKLDDETSGSTFGLTFLDGMSHREERVLVSLQRGLDHIPLVGGSCADGLSFGNTYVIHEGRAISGAGILVLVNTDRPFQLVRSDNFEPMAKKLVVTACDEERRIVREIDAEPAAMAYADAMQIEADHLDPMAFASHPVLVRVGGEYYCRSIQKQNPDGSLSFFCAIDTGVVLTAAKPKDLVGTIQRTLADVDEAVGGTDVIIAFDCVLRRLDAQNRQVVRQLGDVYRHHNVVGFNTYGEQFQAMHLNQTFTGVAIGRRGVSL